MIGFRPPGVFGSSMSSVSVETFHRGLSTENLEISQIFAVAAEEVRCSSPVENTGSHFLSL